VIFFVGLSRAYIRRREFYFACGTPVAEGVETMYGPFNQNARRRCGGERNQQRSRQTKEQRRRNQEHRPTSADTLPCLPRTDDLHGLEDGTGMGMHVHTPQRIPIITVVGARGQRAERLRTRWPSLRIRTTDGTKKGCLAALVRNADLVLVMADFISHAAVLNIVTYATGEVCRVHGGDRGLDQEIQRWLSDQSGK